MDHDTWLWSEADEYMESTDPEYEEEETEEE